MGTSVEVPWLKHLPSDIYFSCDGFVPNSYSVPHSHPWGQLNYVSQGLVYLNVLGRRFISPPGYGIWIPPNTEHSTYNAAAATYSPIYVSLELSRQLSAQPCALAMSSILRAIVTDFAERHVRMPSTPQDLRLAEAAFDQMKASPPHQSFLPYAASAELQSVLGRLEENPGDNRSLAEWAASINMTARTLERRCLSELGMSLVEWRQRLRFMHATDALEAGRTVQQIAFDLSYSTPSAFITMFRRMAGITPEQYRLQKSSSKSRLIKPVRDVSWQ